MTTASIFPTATTDCIHTGTDMVGVANVTGIEGSYRNPGAMTARCKSCGATAIWKRWSNPYASNRTPVWTHPDAPSVTPRAQQDTDDGSGFWASILEEADVPAQETTPEPELDPTAEGIASRLADLVADDAPATREEWLQEAMATFRAWLSDVGATLPEQTRVSVGFPAGSRKAIGQAHYTAEDGHPQLFVHPKLVDTVEVMTTLLHECIHACCPRGTGHRGLFRRIALAVGFQGPMTSTPCGPALEQRLRGLGSTMGLYPHSKLAPTFRKKQGTRMRKVLCPACGYTLRTTAKWLTVGLPTCCCGTDMVEEGAEPTTPTPPPYTRPAPQPPVAPEPTPEPTP